MPLILSQDAHVAPLHQPLQWLIQASHVLEVSSAELMQLVKQEAAENPALEMEEHSLCSACGRPLLGNHCLECPASALASALPSTTTQDDWSLPSIQGGSDSDAANPTDYLPAQLSLAEHLRQALQAELPDDANPVIEYLVGSLDEHGYLQSSVQEAASLLGVSPMQVERVLATLQTQEPAGVGARNVCECLLLQLQSLEAKGQPEPLAVAVVDRFLTELSRRQYGLIARQLGVTATQIEQIHRFIQDRLTPFPAQGYLGAGVSGQQEPERPLIPDVLIRRLPEGSEKPYEVEVVEAQRFSLRVSESYAQAYRERAGLAGESVEKREYLVHSIAQAQFFLSSLRHRWQTLSRITWALVRRQHAYLEHGIRALQPLTRAELAEELGLHPSTISRATTDKYVLLPSAEVVPLATFFTANLSVKAVLQEIIDQAPRPLSDQRLVGILEQRGIQIARRTVAKYRTELGIASSFSRPHLPQAHARCARPWTRKNDQGGRH